MAGCINNKPFSKLILTVFGILICNITFFQLLVVNVTKLNSNTNIKNNK